MSKTPGSVLGGSLLIAGSCIGAGMLGLPIQTGLAGLFPSLVSFLIAWTFMTISGLFLIEVNSWHPHQSNLLTMISQSLGKTGRYICWVFYLFLFYALLVAYMAASGNILSHFLDTYVGLRCEPYIMTSAFVIIFAVIILKGTKAVDHANRFLMIFKILAFCLVILLGLKFIKPSHYSFINNTKVLSSIPILITAFGFHNMIPSITSYMKGNMKKVKKSILGGSLISLVIYLIWQIFVLGVIPSQGTESLQTAFSKGQEASELISEFLQKKEIGLVAQILGFFAILTSFLAQSLSLSHFLKDGLKLKKTPFSKVGVVLLTLIPPLTLATFYPDLFYFALNFAGGICTVILFGIIPSLMLWKGRYEQGLISKNVQVFGGKTTIVIILSIASCVFIYQSFQMIQGLLS